MSMAARVVASNVFLITSFSYIGRMLLAPSTAISRILETVRSFAMPVPDVKLALLAHMQALFGINACLQDTFLINVVGMLATATRLENRGGMVSFGNRAESGD